MTTRLPGAPHPDPSSTTGFAQNRLERRSEKRSDDSTRQALRHDHARFYLVTGGRVLLKHDEEVFDPLFAVGEVLDLDVDLNQSVLLGFERDESPVLAAYTGVDIEHLPRWLKAIDFRSVYSQELLPPDRLGALAQGASLVSWHHSHRFCSKCGAESRIAHGGYRRVCDTCGAQHFPRTDPVVIMLTVTPENDACLLGRSPHFPEKMYSCLAGFVEPGETIEDAVRRETEEEAGVKVGKVAYYASQPWPFPHTLMIGCHAVAESREIRVDEELEDCRWFPREDVKMIIENAHPDEIRMPPEGAIAHHLIQAWAQEE